MARDRPPPYGEGRVFSVARGPVPRERPDRDEIGKVRLNRTSLRSGERNLQHVKNRNLPHVKNVDILSGIRVY